MIAFITCTETIWCPGTSLNWIFLFYVLSLFTYCKMFKRTRNSLDNWLQNSYLTFRNKDFIFILKVAILSFKSLRFILLFRVRSLFEAMFFPILNLHVSVVINFEILLLKFWLKFSASQSAPCSLSLYILCKSSACLYWQICSGVALFAIKWSLS